MAKSAAKNGPCLMTARRNPMGAPRVQAKPNRAIELSSSDLEIVETNPPSRLRLVQLPPRPTQLGSAHRAKTSTGVMPRHLPKPVRAIELSSSDLEIVETNTPSGLRLAQPPPLPNQLVDEETRADCDQSSLQTCPTSEVVRRFGLRAPVGVIAMLWIAVTAAALTMARPPEHPFKIQNEIAQNSTQSAPLANVSQGAPPVLAMKSAAKVRPSSAPKAIPQKVHAQSSHTAVANVKAKSNGKLHSTTATHAKSPANKGTSRRPSTVSFPVDL